MAKDGKVVSKDSKEKRQWENYSLIMMIL
jgi:hypothetical protein